MGKSLYFYVEKQQRNRTWAPIAPAWKEEEVTKLNERGNLVWDFPYRNSLLFDALTGDGYICNTEFWPDWHPGLWKLLLLKYPEAGLENDHERAQELLARDYPFIDENILEPFEESVSWHSLTLNQLQQYSEWNELRCGNFGERLVEQLSTLGKPHNIRIVFHVS